MLVVVVQNNQQSAGLFGSFGLADPLQSPCRSHDIEAGLDHQVHSTPTSPFRRFEEACQSPRIPGSDWWVCSLTDAFCR